MTYKHNKLGSISVNIIDGGIFIQGVRVGTIEAHRDANKVRAVTIDGEQYFNTFKKQKDARDYFGTHAELFYQKYTRK